MNNLNEEHDVLLADDDMEDAEIFGWALKQAEIPHILRRAEDGNHLFILLKEKIPYILFLDIMMPCKDGISCIMEIRKNRDYDGLPVIMYSSCLHGNYVDLSYRNSANFFLVKSHNMQDTVANLKRIFAIDWRSFLHYPIYNKFVLQ